MSYNDAIAAGLGTNGRKLWEMLHHKWFSHTDILESMRNYQQMSKTYADTKLGFQSGEAASNASMCLTMAWRFFWFGPRNLFALKPGAGGEYHRAMRQNYEYIDSKGRKMGDYWSSREGLMRKFGEFGCRYEDQIFALSSEIHMKPPRCLKPGCKHQGMREATKVLKAYAHRDWEKEFARRYRY